MQVHCPKCGHEGSTIKGLFKGIHIALCRMFSQNHNICPQCGFLHAFPRAEWNKIRSSIDSDE